MLSLFKIFVIFLVSVLSATVVTNLYIICSISLSSVGAASLTFYSVYIIAILHNMTNQISLLWPTSLGWQHDVSVTHEVDLLS